MVTPVGRDDVLRLVREQDAQVIEVLPPAEYEDEHLPGAINIPLKELNADTTSRLDRGRPVIVYCYDYQWDMSPRAASRLESLGFEQVYDYVAGKADWGSAGLRLEGRDGSELRVGAHVRTDVPICRLGESLTDVRRRVETTGWETCFVLGADGVVLGRLGRSALRDDEGAPVEEAMTPGPSTIRPSARLEPIVERLRASKLTSIPVTTSGGQLVGLLVREDAERALAGVR